MISSERLAGPGYIILNVLRAMNIVGLLAVVTASVVMLINAFTTNISKFFFFDAVSHVITFCISLFLAVSEMGVFRGWFSRNWPIFADAHGFVMLGLAMVVLGVNILGNMNKEAMSQKSLGTPFWRITLAAAIIVLILGIFNIIASYIFRDKSNHITARQIRSHGATAITSQTPYYTSKLATTTPSMKQTQTPTQTQPSQNPLSIRTVFTPGPSSHSTSSLPTASSVYSTTKSGNPVSNFKSTTTAAIKNFNPARAYRAARDSLLPSYHAANSSTGRNGGGRITVSRPMEISAPLNVNPQFAHLVKPDHAYHPSRRDQAPLGEGPPGGWL